MSETSDRLPTQDGETRMNTGVVSDAILSPRFTSQGVESRTTLTIRLVSPGLEGTNAPYESGRSQGSVGKTSDRLPTNTAQTSDTDEAALDRTMVRLLLELATVSQVSAAPTDIQAADANALRLPVSSRGKALTDDPVGTLGVAYKRASLIPDRDRRLQAKEALVGDAERELHGCRYSRRLTPDLGTRDGRWQCAEYALEHGTRRAAEVYCQDPSDPRSVARMQRNIQNYVVELKRVRGIR